ncbi:MAG: DUF421 domain-containing protein [Gemmatimonadota bacterium]
MDSVIRALFVYVFLMVVLRISGKRSISSMTTFDFVLVLILSETVQQALIDNDNSMTNAALLVLTLVGLDVLLSVLKTKSTLLAKIVDSTPVIIIRQGEILWDRMKLERVDEDEILAAARERAGISRLDQIDYAIVEQSGDITVIPKRGAKK